VLVSGEKALELGLQVIAKIRAYADAAQVMEIDCMLQEEKFIHYV